MKRFFLLAISACFVFVGMTDNAEAKKRDCYANYCNYTGRTCTGWKKLGKVGGFLANKKKKCLSLAKSRAASYAKAYLYKKSTAWCGKRLRVYTDSQVQGKRNSRDGSVYLTNGGWSCSKYYYCPRGYSRVGTYCYTYRYVKYRCLAGSCTYPGVRNGTRVGPYTFINGKLYKTCTKKVVASKRAASWKWIVR